MNPHDLTEDLLYLLHALVLDKGMSYAASQLLKAKDLSKTAKLAVDTGWRLYLAKAGHEVDPHPTFIALNEHGNEIGADQFSREMNEARAALEDIDVLSMAFEITQMLIIEYAESVREQGCDCDPCCNCGSPRGTDPECEVCG